MGEHFLASLAVCVLLFRIRTSNFFSFGDAFLFSLLCVSGLELVVDGAVDEHGPLGLSDLTCPFFSCTLDLFVVNPNFCTPPSLQFPHKLVLVLVVEKI